MLALEVILVPVSNIDRALKFYTECLAFNLDVDYHPTDNFRVVQLTPPGSACSIQLLSTESPERLKNVYLVTDDLAATTAQLSRNGVNVEAIRHKDDFESWAGGWNPGLDPSRRDYASFAEFRDPDGNTWTLQERGYRG
ncbi:VOC family protein [Paraburkholderia flagellata]|uniref:VOC family protein n=1 Tax=Paraburkholderia flagellata TaxID=2883241 RepID=UPI001F22963B|nr:VOC family protein [Paraburkholderia flagellata]